MALSKRTGKEISNGIRDSLSQNTWLRNVIVGIWFIILAVIINLKPIMDGILFEADDVWLHLFWLDQFFHEFQEGILYPRWLATANYGLGSPTFVFYPPMIYFLGSIIRLIVHSSAEQEFVALQTMAAAFAGLAAYFYLKDKFGALVAFVSATFYALSPFLMFDSYISAALPELWTWVEVPIIFLCTDRAAKDSKYLPALALSWAALLLTNIPIATLSLIIWPVYVCTTILWVEKNLTRSVKNVFCRLACALVGMANAAFYLLPAALEKTYINANVWLQSASVDTTYGSQNFNRSPELLPVFWFTIVSSLVLALAALACARMAKEPFKPLIVWIGLLCLQIFLISSFSRPLWQGIQFLQYLHLFAWRGLSFVSLGNAVLFAFTLAATRKLSDRTRLLRILCLVMLAQFLICNALSDFLLAKFTRGLNGTEPEMLSSQVDMKVYAARATALPNLLKSATWFPEAPEHAPMILKTHLPVPEPRPTQPPVPLVFSDGDVQVRRWSSYDRQLLAQSTVPTKLKIRTFSFPGWTAYLDEQRVPIEQADDGLIQIELPGGSHEVEVRFERTIWDRLGILVSALSGAAVLLWFGSSFVTKSKDQQAPTA